MTRSKKRSLKRTGVRVPASVAQRTAPPHAPIEATQVAAIVKPVRAQPARTRLKAKTARGSPPNGATALSADERRAMIEQAAYFRAEQRGFAPGHERDDWVAAESEVDQFLAASAPPGTRSALEAVVGVADDA
jgi:hypothetical protein